MDHGLIYIMVVNLIIWIGIVIYLFKLDRKLKRLEKREENNQ